MFEQGQKQIRQKLKISSCKRFWSIHLRPSHTLQYMGHSFLNAWTGGRMSAQNFLELTKQAVFFFFLAQFDKNRQILYVFQAKLGHNSEHNFITLNSDRAKKKSLLEGMIWVFKTHKAQHPSASWSLILPFTYI